MSESSKTPNACPKCGAALRSATTGGLCPRCLMAEAMVPTQGEAEAASPQPSLAPAELAPYFPQLDILACLGRGGMGVVYQARQRTLNRFVALKLLAPERVADAQFAQRFAQEAQALAALNHPNIVTIYDFGQAGGFYYLLMEFVDGVNLRQAMRAGRFTPEQALAIVPPVCEALQYAHEHGIVHRDIKPENLLLDKEGRVKIADFGIAKMLGADGGTVNSSEGHSSEGQQRPEAAERGTEPTLASAAGTPQYMAPEQKQHRATDHRADIYSLGVVLYELLTGELPAGKLQPPSRKVQIDVRLDEIVLRALEATPERRYQTAGEFRTQVETMASGAGLPPTEPGTITDPSRSWRRAQAGAGWAPPGAMAPPPCPLRPWERRWQSVPTASRRLAQAALGCAAIALLAVFLCPHREVATVGTASTDTWTFGLGTPWLTQVKVFGSNPGNWSKATLLSPSLAAGIGSLIVLLVLAAACAAERGTPGAPLQVVEDADGKQCWRWGRLALGLGFFSLCGVNLAGLTCAAMIAVLHAAPPLLLMLAMIPAFTLAPALRCLVVYSLRNGSPDQPAMAGAPRTPPRFRLGGPLLAAILLVAVGLLVILVAWARSLKESLPPPASPIPVESRAAIATMGQSRA